jgi:hypothetical protein
MYLQLTPCIACLMPGSKTFDFAPNGANTAYAKGAVLLIGRVTYVSAPNDQVSSYDATIEVLKAYGHDLPFDPSTEVVASVRMSTCGERVAPGEIGLFAIRKEGGRLRLLSRGRDPNG